MDNSCNSKRYIKHFVEIQNDWNRKLKQNYETFTIYNIKTLLIALAAPNQKLLPQSVLNFAREHVSFRATLLRDLTLSILSSIAN